MGLWQQNEAACREHYGPIHPHSLTLLLNQLDAAQIYGASRTDQARLVETLDALSVAVSPQNQARIRLEAHARRLGIDRTTP